jgi:hypothetical protein
MTKWLALLALLALTIQASAAAEWTYVAPALGKSPAGSRVKGTMEIDTTSVAPIDNTVQAWFRLTYKADVINPVNAVKPIRRIKLLYYHACEQHRRALIQIVYEDASGASVYTTSFAGAAPKFEDVLPDTTGQAWLQAACRIAAMKRKTAVKP